MPSLDPLPSPQPIKPKDAAAKTIAVWVNNLKDMVALLSG
jgi:hypothetical protein